jgi:hypothetical protein
MTSPVMLRDQFRAKAYSISVLLIILALGTAAATNWKDQYVAVSTVEIIVILLLVFTIPLALKNKYLESFGNTASYLVGFMLLYNTTQIGGVDPGPYVGLIAMLIINSLLTIEKRSFFVYSAILYLGYLSLSLSGLVGLATTVDIKYQMVFIVLIVMIGLNKQYQEVQDNEMFVLAEQSQKMSKKANKAAMLSSAEATEYKEQKIALEKLNGELARLNEVMVGRETKMIELKKKITELQK